jgi:hypothetical protein
MVAFCGPVYAQAADTITIRILDSKTAKPLEPSGYLVNGNHTPTIQIEWVKVNEDGTGALNVPAGVSVVSIHGSYDQATGWRIAAVPGLVPDDVFFGFLARRRFPSTCFIRRRDQLDYLQEPDVFHDICGHVPMLMNPVFADYMQAYGEGYEILAASEMGIDTDAALGVWQHGSVVRSWLLDLLVKAMADDPGLATIKGVAADSGEGRWTVEEAIRLGVPAPVVSAALFARFASQQEDSPTLKVVAALRNQFGGHAVQSS